MRYVFLLIGISISCTQAPTASVQKNLVKDEQVFQLQDSNGTFIVKKETKTLNGKLLTRQRLFDQDGMTQLENTVAVSRLGRLGNEIAVLPEASQFKVWFEKEEYFSQIKVDSKSKSANVTLKNPKPEWKGTKSFDLPSTRYICFFSQLPECLKLQKLLLKSARKKQELYIIWDNFPYHKELYTGLDGKLVELASLTVSEHNSNEFRFSLDIGSQILFFHYDKDLNFTKMFWVAQGISLISIKR